MSKEFIVSVNGREKKIAILDNGKVTEFYIERGEENSGVVGNVYKGRVMRVLPGMQSAFVDIGLERDAFLYVSDFFDEEEEIERIVQEKGGKKGATEEAKREARDQVERQRLEREKQMDGAQAIAEPIAAAGISLDVESSFVEEEPAEDEKPTRGKRGGRGRGRKGDERAPRSERSDEPAIELDFDNSGFERIADSDDEPSASTKETKVERARAVKFDMESAGAADVGSLLDDLGSSSFERIADEDDQSEAPAKGKKKAASKKAAKPKKESAKKKPSSKRSKSKETDGSLPDGEASVREPSDRAEMAVRRGGRGRRRGGKKNGKAEGSQTDEATDDAVHATDDQAIQETNETPDAVHETNGADEPVEERSDDRPEERTGDRDRDRGRGKRGGRDRNDRNDRNDRGRSGGRNDRNRGDRNSQPAISDLLKEGQEILVQIAKEPIAKKGARITSHIALPGRYLVYMPTIEHLGVSRKIESASERSRLRTMLQKISQDPDIPSGGFIVRTAGIGISEDDLRNDARFLAKSWASHKKASEKKKAPAIVHQDLDLVQRLLRDQLANDFSAIRVDSEEEYLATIEFMERMAPKMVNRVKLYTRDEPILDYYHVQEEIDKALKPRVWLKSGGYLVINQTEALVAIDVNTGKFVGKGNARLEDTITRTNMEAVDEIARQIRLRDLGGIIVLDLIDMEDRRNRHKVADALKEALSTDRSPTKVLSFNDFGLIIMTRKRVKQSLERTMCAPCDNCEGAGWVKSATTVAYEILAEARRLSKQVDDVRHTTLRVHPDVSRALRNEENDVLLEIEAYLGNVDINADKAAHQDQFDFAFV